MFTSMAIILAYEIVAGVKGALFVPDWLYNLRNRVCKFWEKVLQM